MYTVAEKFRISNAYIFKDWLIDKRIFLQFCDSLFYGIGKTFFQICIRTLLIIPKFGNLDIIFNLVKIIQFKIKFNHYFTFLLSASNNPWIGLTRSGFLEIASNLEVKSSFCQSGISLESSSISGYCCFIKVHSCSGI